MGWLIVRSEVSPYFGRMVGTAAIAASIKPGTTCRPCGSCAFGAAASFGMAASACAGVEHDNLRW